MLLRITWWTESKQEVYSQRKCNVPHVARSCGSAEMVIRRRCVQIVQTSVNRRATRCEQRAALFFLKISILTSEPKSGIHREPDVALFHFKVGDSRFSLRDCQRPAGAGRATCARGSLTICRSETGMTQSGMAIPDIKNRESLMKIGKVLMENRESLMTIGKDRKQPQKDRTLLATCGLL